MIVVVVLPFTRFLVEQVDIVRDAVLVEHLVELLFLIALFPTVESGP
tara:strand:+ start:192 stop:332 length:141 start_codon:yes stop_codon:yes gene_type:complete